MADAAMWEAPIATIPVTITYEDLCRGEVPKAVLEQAFGPQGLGLVCVTGGHDFSEKVRSIRRSFLPWGSCIDAKTDLDLGNLRVITGTEDVTVVESRRRQGKNYDGHWLMEPLYKSALNYRYSAWKDGEVAGESATTFGELGINAAGFVANVGGALAKQLDSYIKEKLAEEGAGYDETFLARMVAGGDHFVRLLSYHSIKTPMEAEEMGGYWARPHFDIGLLTGLVPGVFVEEGTGAVFGEGSREARHISESLAPSSGLVSVDRQGRHHKVMGPHGREALFFQTGEAMNVVSGGIIQATPHYVLGPQLQNADSHESILNVDRNTLAVFLSVQEEIPIPAHCTLEGIAARTFDISRLGVRWPSLGKRLEEMSADRQRFFQGAQSLSYKHYEAQLSEWRSAPHKIAQMIRI